jgi:SAM-dependent methyltransferase
MSDQSSHPNRNLDPKVVAGFGDEWRRFSNREVDSDELISMFEAYASIFPWEELPPDPVGFDAGCGSGRWAMFFADRVGHLHCVDASDDALAVARETLGDREDVTFHHATLEEMPIASKSCDFGYSLGVLHHIPDTESALAACVDRLRPGAPFLVYLYYGLDGVGPLRRFLFRVVTVARGIVSRLPRRARVVVADLIALFCYLPLARTAAVVEYLGHDPSQLPLFQYRDRSFYVMRNDALDRFGTQLEKRFNRLEVEELLAGAGLERIQFSEGPPWWVAVGRRARL